MDDPDAAAGDAGLPPSLAQPLPGAQAVPQFGPDALQALLAAIVESSDDAIVSKTLDGIITSWNAGAERLYGYSAAEAIGKSITIVIPPERHGEEDEILRRLRAGQRIQHFETVRRCKSGELIEVSLTVSPIRDSSGRIVGASKTARDITLRKRAEAALRDNNRRKEEFLAILSHELRNPLAPLASVSRLLLQNPSPEQVRWAGQLMERQVRHMARLIDDLMDVSRINSGKIVLQKKTIDLGQTIAAAVESTRPLIESLRHLLSIALPPGPILLEADPERLQQVFANLLNNAAKYTDAGGRIRIQVELREQAVCVAIRDSGIGIPADQLRHIFDLYIQADQGLTRSRGGLGVGLTLARKLVELHGGSLSAASAGPGQGSEFTVRLPLQAQAPAPAPAPGSIGASPGGPRRRILVVDDNRDATDAMTFLLRQEGHEVAAAYDGAEALALARTFHPEVALLDLGLPRLDGNSLALRLRERFGSGIRLIAATGWSQSKEQRSVFDCHLVKPVEIEALLKLLGDDTPAS
jgi:PAS domain S-box-containing protein